MASVLEGVKEKVLDVVRVVRVGREVGYESGGGKDVQGKKVLCLE